MTVLSLMQTKLSNCIGVILQKPLPEHRLLKEFIVCPMDCRKCQKTRGLYAGFKSTTCVIVCIRGIGSHFSVGQMRVNYQNNTILIRIFQNMIRCQKGICTYVNYFHKHLCHKPGSKILRRILSPSWDSKERPTSVANKQIFTLLQS